jgi:hypothetical protein
MVALPTVVARAKSSKQIRRKKRRQKIQETGIKL